MKLITKSNTMSSSLVRSANRMIQYCSHRKWEGSASLIAELMDKADCDVAFSVKLKSYILGTSATSTIFLRKLVDELKGVEDSYFGSLGLANDVDGIDTAHLYLLDGDFKDIDPSIFTESESDAHVALEEHPTDVIKVVVGKASLSGNESENDMASLMAGHLALRSNGLLMTSIELNRQGVPAYIISTWKLSDFDHGNSEELPKGQRYSFIPRVLFEALTKK